MNTTFLLRLVIAFGAGALAHLAMAPTYYIGALFLALPALYILVKNAETSGGIFLLGWMFGFGYFIFGLHWIGNALLVEGNAFAWAYPLAVAGIPFLLSFFPATLLWLGRRLADYATPLGWCNFVFALFVSELMRGTLFTGFPWNLYGAAWGSDQHLPIAQTVSVVGLYGLTLLTLFWAAAPGLIWSDGHRPPRLALLIFSLASLSAAYYMGAARLAHTPTEEHPEIVLHIIQPNIAQHQKWERELLDTHLNTLYDLSEHSLRGGRAGAVNYIIWPETATIDWLLFSPQHRDRMTNLLQTERGDADRQRERGFRLRYLMAGLLRSEGEGDNRALFNSFVMIGPDTNIKGMYDKHHLVPFGEYIPFNDYIPLSTVTGFSGFQPGAGLQSLPIGPTNQQTRISPLICYEIIFPGRAIPGAGSRPDLIVNVTNDGWYGLSIGPHQHYAMGRFRAIESGVPVARSANTGISALFDPLGRIQGRIELGLDGTLSRPLPLKIDATFFASNIRGWPVNTLLPLAYILFCLSFSGYRRLQNSQSDA